MVHATEKGVLHILIDQFCFGVTETCVRSIPILYDTSKFISASHKIPEKFTYQVVNTYPHDTGAYTQGFIFENGYLFESTGQTGQSSLRKVKLSTGEIVKAINLPDSVFGEGLTSFRNKLIQLSWKSKMAFIVDKGSFKTVCTIPYTIDEGWGLTNDSIHLIMSDGSANLYFLDPVNLKHLHTLKIFNDQGPVDQLNELEFVDNEIWANVFTKDVIVRINPESGEIIGEIDLSGLLSPQDRNGHVDVLNGIAWDPVLRRIFITGKNWPKVFEISIRQKL